MQSDLMPWIRPQRHQSQDTLSKVEIEERVLGVVQCVALVNHCWHQVNRLP